VEKATQGESMSTIEITDQNFEHIVMASEKSVLVDFWAPWCGPCKSMVPALEEIAVEHSSMLSIAKINLADNPESAKRYRVMSLPTLILFQDQRPVKTITGARSKAGLLAELAEYIAI
jgi:thioredoxin 1